MSGLSFSASSTDQALQTEYPSRLRDNLGRTEVSEVQNLFEADFEYGTQPMRWENYTTGGATIVQVSAIGGVQMSVTANTGDVAIRQTRPYIRYQPGKTIYMSSGFLFGTPYTNQRQRVGFFDDGNGIFFEQGDPTANNPTGMAVVYRTDVNGVPTDTRITSDQWLDPQGIKSNINWSNIQMIWIEFAWYGAGLLRWGVMINGEPCVLHQVGIGNKTGQVTPWSRTGNVPVRYELRNIGAIATGSSPYTMQHFGVSVLAKGKIDTQRGFTYGYGMAAGTPTRAPGSSATRYPLLSIRYRAMGTLEYGVDSAYSGSNGTLPSGGAAITGVSSSVAVIATSTISGTTLTVGSVTSGTVAIGQTINGNGVLPGTVILSGSGSTWTVNNSQTLASSTLYLAGTVITASGATWTVGQWAGKYVFSRGSSVAISSVTASAGSAVINTSAANYMTIGRYITISGATGNTTLNGTFQVTAIGSGTSFTITGSTITTGSVTGSPVYTQGEGGIGRISYNTATALYVADNVVGSNPMLVPPATSGNYIIGEIDRGQILPQLLSIYSSANCTLELIASTFYSPVALTGASFATMYSLGSLNSFVERDVSATALSGGEVVYNTPLPSGGLQNFDLTNFFPLYTTVQGNAPDILTVAITTPSGFSGNVGASLIGQEAMS